MFVIHFHKNEKQIFEKETDKEGWVMKKKKVNTSTSVLSKIFGPDTVAYPIKF